MDLSTIHFLFSVVFVLIGSLAFHTSALLSGEDIFRHLPTLEATLLSTVAGIVIFSLSPISFIILQSTTSTNILVEILDFEVLLPFFCGAFGFGLIFGSLTILKARVTILDWFRDTSGMGFWISGYGITWDDFLLSVKRKGEIFVQRNDDNIMFKGLLKSFSIRDEPREIVLERVKSGRREEEIEGEENTVLIPGSEIKRITVPERSFRKHFESMGHISQAFYCQILAIGFFFLSFSSFLTKNYLPSLELTSKSLASVDSLYFGLSVLFLSLTIICLIHSVWTAKIDFDNLRSFLVLSPVVTSIALIFLLIAILHLIFIMQMQILQVPIFIFALLLFVLFYINFAKGMKKPRNSIKEIYDCFIVNPTLENVIQSCYLKLSCNDKNKALIGEEIRAGDITGGGICPEIYSEYDDDPQVKNLLIKIVRLKSEEYDYLKKEDFNIIVALKYFIKKGKGKKKRGLHS
jgi:hypothetical protein